MKSVGSSILKILALEILQSALNDPKLNSNNLAWKVSYTYSLYLYQILNFH